MPRAMSAAVLFLCHSAFGGYVQLNSTAHVCGDKGMNVITSASQCKQAAEALGLRNPTLTFNVGTTNILYRGSTPYGCYYERSGLLTKGLWFNPSQASTATGTQHDDWPICAQPDAGAYATRPGLHVIPSFDGTKLTADSEVPVSTNAGEKFPLMIFINSWGVPQIEYLVKTLQWAKSGYICVEYQARGWYLSGGEIGTAGENDRRDVSAVIDWALKKWPEADPSRIAVGGISYGGGIATLASSSDARIRVVLAMSGWSDIYGALNWHDSPSRIWASLLVLLGEVAGREEQELHTVYNMLLSHTNMSYVKSWSAQRSAVTFLDAINKNNPAVYISHNHGDNLFHSSIELDMWQRLTTPKKLDLNQGTHASAETWGCLALKTTGSDHVWNNAKNWVDHYLKNIDNGVDKQPKVQMQLGNDGAGSGYVSFDSWPPSQGWSTTQYLLQSRSDTFGQMTTPATQSSSGDADVISYSALHDGMSTGVVLLSDFLKQLVPIVTNLADVDPQHAVVYSTGAVGPAKVCGVPKLSNLWVIPDQDTFQVVIYLYARDASTNEGRLITHGVTTIWNATKGELYGLPSIDMHTCCFDLKDGNALALGIDMYDSLYKPANTNVSIAINYATHGGPIAEIPYVASN